MIYIHVCTLRESTFITITACNIYSVIWHNPHILVEIFSNVLMFMAFEFIYLWSRLFTPCIHLMQGLASKPVYWHLIWSLSVVNNSKVVMDLYRWSGLLILSTINKETLQYLSTFFLSFKWYLCNICVFQFDCWYILKLPWSLHVLIFIFFPYMEFFPRWYYT